MSISVELLLRRAIPTEENTIAPGWGSVLLGSVIVIGILIIPVSRIKSKLALMESLQQGICLSLFEQLIIFKELSIVFISHQGSKVFVVTINTVV